MAVKQLVSDNIQIYTTIFKNIKTLKKDQRWIKIIEANNKIITPIYEIIIYGIPKRNINIQDQKIIIQRITADNATFIPGLEIVYIKWLVKEQKNHKKNVLIIIKFIQLEYTN